MGNPGSFDLSPNPGGIATTAAPIAVCLYSPGGDDDEDSSPYTILPNVYCLRIDYREGPQPPVARFRYLMDDNLAATLDWPSQFEQLWPIDAQGDYLVMNDDRLVVLTQDPEGDPIVLFDGFAQIPQVDVGTDRQDVNFAAIGVAVRLWDKPIVGRTQRDGEDVEDTSGEGDVYVYLPCRWNPSDTSIGSLGGYVANAIGADYDTEFPEEEGASYPVFVDPLLIEINDDYTNYWYVPDALAYLIGTQPSPEDAGQNPYVIYPTIGSLNDLLACQAPPGDGSLNSGDVTSSPIFIRDYDASNKAVPDVMAELLRYCGFVMNWQIGTDDDGNPQTNLNVTRRDALATVAPKPLYLAAGGASDLDVAANNVTQMHLARDCNQVINQWRVETDSKQYEVSVFLAPLFEPSAGDAANPAPFIKQNLTLATADQRRMYRWFGVDELGTGFWSAENSEWITGTAFDFSPIFKPTPDGTPTYVTRYRPGSRTIIAKDPQGKPLKAILEVCPGVKSGEPGFSYQGLDGYVTVPGGWSLLHDRFGIEVTAANPDNWTTTEGPVTADGGSANKLAIRAITGLAAPTAESQFTLRLTTVIEADRRMNVLAPTRPASPTQFVRERVIDGKDHFQYCAIDKSSINYAANNGDGTNPVVIRDDTAAALTHAEQLRSAHEFPTLAGSATLPFITDYYQIGDRVNVIEGRDASLQINVGTNQGEMPSYPWITAFAWEFQGNRQQTILQFSDRRAEPQGV